MSNEMREGVKVWLNNSYSVSMNMARTENGSEQRQNVKIYAGMNLSAREYCEKWVMK